MKIAVVLGVLFFLIGACKEEEKSAKNVTYEVVLVSSTMQAVTEAVDPVLCPSGWTALVDNLGANGHLPPLQSAYVNRFPTFNAYAIAISDAAAHLKELRPTIRISTVWPCWVNNPAWREDMIYFLSNMRNQGVTIELVLSHHDSYPITLEDTSGGFAKYSGWAHDNAVEEFVTYTNWVIEELGSVLPIGTRVYLAYEPMGMLFNSYFGSGNWPPGGKEAKAAFVKSLTHMRLALRESAMLVRDAGFVPLIAQNTRPMIGEITKSPLGTAIPDSPDARLSYIFNYWLIDALVTHCNDNNFDAVDDVVGTRCADLPKTGAISELGVTYYGTMTASNRIMELPVSNGTVRMALPNMDFAPDGRAFGDAMRDLAAAYSGIPLHVSELGFSSGKSGTQKTWLEAYLAEVRSGQNTDPSRVAVRTIGIHSLFNVAEFSPGEWNFHLLDGCGNEPCQLTTWGEEVIETFRK